MHPRRPSSLLLVLLGPLAACASTPTAPATPEQLGQQVLAALRAGDLAAFERLYWSPRAAGAVCDADVGERVARERIRARQPFLACRRDIPWSDVHDVHVLGGVADKPRNKCGGRAVELTDVLVTFAMPGPSGTEFGRVVVDDALVVDDASYHLAGDLQCREVPEGYAACREIAHTAATRSSRDIGAHAFALEGELVTGCEQLRPERREKLRACVQDARELVALDACYTAAHAYEPPTETQTDPDAPATPLPRHCEHFLASYSKCVEAMPEEAQEAARDGLRQMREAWSGAPRDALDDACRSALPAMRDAMGAACPGVFDEPPGE